MSVKIVFEKKQKAYTTHVEENGIFFVQLDTKEAYKLAELSDRISKSIESTGTHKVIPEYGLKCFALSKTDQTWYRALVVKVKSSNINVFYVDYGNTEDLAIEQLSASVDSFFEFPYQSVCCTIANFIPKDANFGSKVKDLIMDRETCCVFLSKNGSKGHPFLQFLPCFNVLLYENEKSDVTLAEFLIKRKLGEYAVCADNAEVGTNQNVVVSFVDSPGKFWVQLSKKMGALEELMKELNSPTTLRSLASLPDASIREGVACCGLYDNDVRFYRAEISSRKSGTKVKVWFGDYGNTLTVATKDLKILPQQFTRSPFCALMCGLDGVLPVRSDKPHPIYGNIAWTPQASKDFTAFALEEEFVAHFVSELSPDVYTVRLTDPNTGKDMGRTLADNGIVELSASANLPNEIPADFENITIEVGKVYEKLFITHVESPSIVWGQLPDYLEEMEALTATLESIGASLPELIDPEVGASCCAQYSVDNAWYRGTIESVNVAAKNALVLFVDYGNSEEVQLTSLKALPSDYFALPAQAISFSMATVAPYKDDWSEDARDFFVDLVREKELNCLVIRLDDDGYPSVTLSDPQSPDYDIAQELVQCGYAIELPPSIANLAVSSEPQATVAVPKHSLNCPPEVETAPVNYEFLSIEVGKLYESVFITHAESPSVVWCQLPEYLEEMEALTATLESIGSSLPELIDPELGASCCAQYSVDNAWYRGTIESVNVAAKTALVLFVDYGNSEEVKLTSLKALPSDCFALPAQAISFSMATVAPCEDDWSEDACDFFVNLVREKELNFSVIRLDDDGYPSVILFDPCPDSDISQELLDYGYAVKLHAETEKDADSPELQAAVSIPKLKPPSLSELLEFEFISLEAEKCYKNIFITHVESPSVVWCQLPEYLEEMEALTATLESVGPSLPALNDPEVGASCCAQYSVDNAWYRGTIESVNVAAKTALVLFVDYGNSEEVKVTSLKALPSDCFALPAQAISFSIATVAPRIGNDWNKDACQCFISMVQERELNCEVIQLDADDYPYVHLFDPLHPNTDIGQELVRRGFAKKHLPASSNEDSDVRLVPSGAQVAVASPIKITEQIPKQPLCYNNIALKTGCTYEVLVCHVESLTNFYCQLTESSPDLDELMDNIRCHCGSLNSSSPVDVSNMVNQPIIALFSEDSEWYRAQICRIESEGSVFVKFVDYGNCESVCLDTTKNILKTFVQTPAQAISCSLYCAPENTDISDDTTTTFSSLTLDQNFTLSVKKITDDNQIVADLKCEDGTTITQQLGLIHASAATPDSSAIRTVPPPIVRVNCPTTVVPCFIDTPFRFYLQLADDYETLKTFVDSFNDFYKLNGQNLEPYVGCLCAAKFSEDHVWYRAKITVICGSQVDVEFVDYGNSETTTMSAVRALDSQFLSVPCFAVPCYLNGLPKDQSTDADSQAFSNLISDKELTAEFHAPFSDFDTFVAVQLTTKEGQDILATFLSAKDVLLQEQIMLPTFDTQQIKTLSPDLNTPTMCTVSFISSCKEFYCQLSTFSTHFNELMDNLYAFYEEGSNGSLLAAPGIGSYCAAPFSDDGSWYRGVITDLISRSASVFYMDYGNTSEVELSKLMQLEQQFCSLPIQALLCSLPQQYSNENCSNSFQDTLDQSVEVTFIDRLPDGNFMTNMKVNGIQIKEILAPYATPNLSTTLDNTDISAVIPECGLPMQVTVCFVASFEEFYCQILSESAFDSLMNDLYSFYAESGESRLLATPAVGRLCAAPFGDDGSWYRAKITTISGENANLFYIDYGNSESLPLSLIMELEPQFCGLPAHSIKCCLKNFTATESPECLTVFQEIILQKEVLAVFEPHVLGDCYSVTMEVNGRNISEILIEAVSPASLQPVESVTASKKISPTNSSPKIPLLSLEPGSTCDVVVTAFNSAEEFYCQVVDIESKLDFLMVEIKSFCESSPQSTEWCEKECVLARFTEDEEWYRAQIVNLNKNGTVKVYYVDYGNSDVLNITELRKITSTICQLPAQVVKCALEGSQFYSYGDTSHQQWCDLLLDQEMKLKCVSVKDDETYTVDLQTFDTNVDIMSHAIKTLKIVSPRNVDPAVELSENNIVASTDVRITCVFPADLKNNSFHDALVQSVDSPSLFYSHFDVRQLQSLMNSMQNFYTSTANPLEPVALSNYTAECYLAAQYSEDDLWYRCLVEGVSSTGVEVKFVDYGNSEMVPYEKLRFLDSEFTKLPAQAIPCSLGSISPLGSEWSDEAIDTFSELVVGKTFKSQVMFDSDLTEKPFTFDGRTTLNVVLIDDQQLPVSRELISLSLAGSTDDHRLQTDNTTISASAVSPQEDALTYIDFTKPSVGDICDMYVSHINSPVQFWLQMPTADDVLTVLQSELSTVCEGNENIVLVNRRSACCAKFSEDGCWYRSTVQDESSEGLTVRFVDYGNSETVPASQVFELQPKFLETPVQAIECSLASIEDNTFTEENVSVFSGLVMGKELLVSFVKQLNPQKWEVNLQEGERGIDALFLATLQTEKILETSPALVTIPSLDIELGETYPVYIAFSDSPSKFFCQLKSDCDKLEVLMDEVSKYYSSHCVEPDLTPGLFCVAQYSGTGTWYRAQIIAVHSKSDIEVNFVDYGNSEHVAAEQIHSLVDKFSQLCSQGIPCSLVHDYTMEFTNAVLEQFFRYDLNQEFKIKIRAVHEDRYVVDLFDQEGAHMNASVLGMIVSPSSASPVDKHSYIPTQLSVGSSIQAYVSHVNSPTNFYCQPLEQAAELENLMSQIVTVMSPPLASHLLAIEDLIPGRICLAQYSEDNEWYRALVKSVKDIEVSLLYVDYGNTELSTSDKIVDLPEQFQPVAIQAIHCSAFEGLDTDMRWKEEQTSKFQKLVSQCDHITVTVTSVSPTGQYVMEVSTNGNIIDFSSLLEEQVEGLVPLAPLQSLSSEPADLIDFSKVTTEGSAASSTSLDTGSECGETESDSESVGKPLIKAPFKLSLAIQESLEVNVVFVQSPSLMYIQRADCKAVLNSLSEEIKQYCANFGDSQKEFSLTFHKGDYVLAKNSADGEWYRAEVTGVDSEDGTTKVSLIDYGNIEIIPPEDVVMCPENLLELPAQAIPCSLAQVPRRDSWPLEYKELINRLVEGRVLRATVILPASQGMRPTVKLEDIQTNIDLSDQVLLNLHEECEFGSNNVIAELSEGEDLDPPLDAHPEVTEDSSSGRLCFAEEEPNIQEVRLLRERKFEIGSAHSVFVLTCESPHYFLCQLTDEAGILESIVSQLKQLCDSPLDNPPQQGNILASQFSEDYLWYRARVDSSESGLTEVTFIDYGNSEAVTLDKLQFLPKSLLSHPPLALECFLAGIEACSIDGVFCEDAAVKFLEHVGDKEARIEIVSIDTTGHLGVVLTTATGVNIGNVLIESKLASPLIASPETDLHSLSNVVKEPQEHFSHEDEEPINPKDIQAKLVVSQQNMVSVEEVRVEVTKENEDRVPLPDLHIASSQDDEMADTAFSVQETSHSSDETTVSVSVNYVAAEFHPESESISQQLTSMDPPPVNTNENNSNGSALSFITESNPTQSTLTQATNSYSINECYHAYNLLPASEDEEIFSQPENEYATIFSTPTLTPGSRHKVEFVHLATPEDFVCVLTEKADILKQMATEMTDNDSLPAVKQPAPGLPVAVFNDKDREWCRAVVRSVGMSLSMVKLYLLDKGTSDMTPLSKLRPLSKSHAELLPPQALRCQLSVLHENDFDPNVVTKGEPWELNWPNSCSHHLRKLTENSNEIYLEILSAGNDYTCTYEVTLLDCSTDPALNLRQVVIDKLRTLTETTVLSPICPIAHEESFEAARMQVDFEELSNPDDQVTVGVDSMAVTPPFSPEPVSSTSVEAVVTPPLSPEPVSNTSVEAVTPPLSPEPVSNTSVEAVTPPLSPEPVSNTFVEGIENSMAVTPPFSPEPVSSTSVEAVTPPLSPEPVSNTSVVAVTPPFSPEPVSSTSVEAVTPPLSPEPVSNTSAEVVENSVAVTPPLSPEPVSNPLAEGIENCMAVTPLLSSGIISGEGMKNGKVEVVRHHSQMSEGETQSDVLPSEIQAAIPGVYVPSNYDDRDFIDGETSVSTGEGDRSAGKISDSGEEVAVSGVEGETSAGEMDMSRENNLHPSEDQAYKSECALHSIIVL